MLFRQNNFGGFATSADPVKELRGGGLRIRESPGEFSQGPPGRGGGDLSGGVPGSSPWELGGGGLGVPEVCNLNRNLAAIWPESGRNLAAIWPQSGRNLAGNLLSGEWPSSSPHTDPPLQLHPESGRNLAATWPQTC